MAPPSDWVRLVVFLCGNVFEETQAASSTREKLLPKNQLRIQRGEQQMPKRVWLVFRSTHTELLTDPSVGRSLW